MSNLKYTYETKIKFLDDEIKMIEKYIKINKKQVGGTLFLCISILIIITIIQLVTERTINALDVLSISLMVTTLHSLISNYFEEQPKLKHNLKLTKKHRDDLVELMKQLDDLSESNKIGV